MNVRFLKSVADGQTGPEYLNIKLQMTIINIFLVLTDKFASRVSVLFKKEQFVSKAKLSLFV